MVSEQQDGLLHDSMAELQGLQATVAALRSADATSEAEVMPFSHLHVLCVYILVAI